MEENAIITVLGSPITMGIAASWLMKILKATPWFPLFAGQVVRLRITLAILCTTLAGIALYMEGGELLVPFYSIYLPDPSWLLTTAYGYFVASAAYIHIFQD